MKKQMSAVLALGLALTMTACAPQNVADAADGRQAPPAVNTEAAAEPETTAPQTAMENPVQTTETAAVEGMEETAALTRYDGQGYSIMIPDGQWRLESEWEDGRPAQTWESIYHPDVELEVQWLAGLSKEQAQGFLMADEDDFQLETQPDGSMMGRDTQDGEILFARFYPSETGTFVLTYSYPDTTEMEEGFGAGLSSIADSFQLK